ncbi:hypothetical protein F511_25459 [Dorcoceras hygrometricum]|uniref:Uncharacterized protein n=1 Tax=Dorcoceras hygrometricum TaxID=472368 RepID=A0A2Z7CUW0_9LAMI|nr:hypothetical protein F511_25459 [Dorcoceras hygrometricum]
MVTAWLINSMEPSIGRTFLFLPTTQEVWDAVRETYSDLENSSQIFDLKTRLWQSRQGQKTVFEYYNEMKGLWQEPDLCYDDKWECKHDSLKYHKRMEGDRVYVFLAGLNRDLDEVRGRILERNLLPSLGEVFAEVRREEGRRKIMLSSKLSPTTETSAMVSKHFTPTIPNRQPKKAAVVCEHCQKPWHTADTCWDLHGKPPNWNPSLRDKRGSAVPELINLVWSNKTTLKHPRGQPLLVRNK